MPYDPEIAQRVISEGSYTVESSNGGYGGLLFGISMMVLAGIIGYKLYQANKKKS